jgi:hypothetical protein
VQSPTYSSRQIETFDSLEVTPVSCQQRTAYMEHHTGDRTISHSDAEALALEGSPDGGGAIGRENIEPETKMALIWNRGRSSKSARLLNA